MDRQATKERQRLAHNKAKSYVEAVALAAQFGSHTLVFPAASFTVSSASAT